MDLFNNDDNDGINDDGPIDDGNGKADGKPTEPRKRRIRRRTFAIMSHRRGADPDDPLKDIPSLLPVLPLRDVAVFNTMIIPLMVGRESSAAAIETAQEKSGSCLFIVMPKNEGADRPTMEDLCPVGSIVRIMRLLKMPDGHTVKALVQGVARGRLRHLNATGPCPVGDVEPLRDLPVVQPDVEREALMRFAKEQCERILSMHGIPTREIMGMLDALTDPGRMADVIAANLRLNMEQAQEIIACLDPVERLHIVVADLVHEGEVAQVQARIQNSTKEQMDKEHKEYFLREQIQAIRKELGDTDEAELEELMRSLDEAHLSEAARKEADKQLKRLESMREDAAEATVIRTYLDWMSELPWDAASEDNLSIAAARKILEEDHHGLTKIKGRILEYLSVRKLNPDPKGSIICFSGPPGVGKTSLGRSIARAMNRKFERISLGGIRDEAEIRGHRRTYIGSMPGRIIQAMRNAGTRNPVIMLDELDKLGADFRGDPSSALLEALDPEQNAKFSDHYLNVPFDLSKVLFICTANHPENIPDALRDRLEMIPLSGYTLQEKVAIAKRYLVPRQKKESGLADERIRLGDTVLTKIADEYTREAGVRELDRTIGSVFRKLALRKAEGAEGPFSVTASSLHELLGAPKFLKDERDEDLPVGEALGLAWTPVGGVVLHIEVAAMKGKGTLTLTGQLGDVMKESATAALSYVRAHAKELDIDPEFASTHDIHIHVPDGATPKDGPSAGVTLATALISQLSGRSVRGDLCMTGEISLHGHVLPVGGIKEKILAGVALGLGHVFIPAKNEKDLEDVPEDLRSQIGIHLASDIGDVLGFALLPRQAKKQKAPRK